MATIVIFLVLIVALWFVMIRPQQRRQREAQQMRTSLVPGAKVMLTSGIFGTVNEITDDYILVEIAEGAEIKVVRAAIGRILPEDVDEPSTEDAADETVEGAAGETADEAADVTAPEIAPETGAEPDVVATDDITDESSARRAEPEDDR